MINPSDALRDPDFHALPEIERLKVLYKIDPDYRKLHPRERWKVITMIPKPPRQMRGQPHEGQPQTQPVEAPSPPKRSTI